jgi:hypothetical protein
MKYTKTKDVKWEPLRAYKMAYMYLSMNLPFEFVISRLISSFPPLRA